MQWVWSCGFVQIVDFPAMESGMSDVILSKSILNYLFNVNFALPHSPEETNTGPTWRNILSSAEICIKYFLGTLGSMMIKSMMFQSLSENGDKLWCCSYCDFQTKKSTNIQDHIEAKHVSSRIQCNLCSADFTTSSYLKKHIKKVHTNLLY